MKQERAARRDGFSDWRDEIGTPLVVSKPIDGNNVNYGYLYNTVNSSVPAYN